MAQEQKKLSGHPAGTSVSERRTQQRFPFTAAVELVNTANGERLDARVSDLGRRGCYVEASHPLAVGTSVKLRITKGTKTFDAQARIVYSQENTGMGVMFTVVGNEQVRTLEAWLASSFESSWFSSPGRRSRRILLGIPVRMSVQTEPGSFMREETKTLAISAHGALVLLKSPVKESQRIALENLKTEAIQECIIAYIGDQKDGRRQVGLEFSVPNPSFWRVSFPPDDWTPNHPEAKSRTR
jgi:hypothetical protein